MVPRTSLTQEYFVRCLVQDNFLTYVSPNVIDAPVHRIPVDVLTGFTRRLLEQLGLTPDHAEIMSANLVEADMRGVKSHGHWLMKRYSEWLNTGYMNPRPNIRVVHESAATVLVDGDCGPGHLAGAITMRRVIEKAHEAGSATGLTRNSRHYGAAAHYALMATNHDMVGYSATNAGPTMFAYGGRERVVGNNPIAYAFPARNRRPLVLDMAMSMSANGRIAIMESLGQQLPEGWALNKLGQPTTDPRAFTDEGAGAPIGGPKGIGLAQVIDALTGILSGSGFGQSVGRVDGSDGTIAHAFQVIDIAAFIPVEQFKERLGEQIRQFHESEPAEGVDQIMVPGELEWRAFEDAETNGVPLLASVITTLNEIASRMRIPEQL